MMGSILLNGIPEKEIDVLPNCVVKLFSIWNWHSYSPSKSQLYSDKLNANVTLSAPFPELKETEILGSVKEVEPSWDTVTMIKVFVSLRKASWTLVQLYQSLLMEHWNVSFDGKRTWTADLSKTEVTETHKYKCFRIYIDPEKIRWIQIRKGSFITKFTRTYFRQNRTHLIKTCKNLLIWQLSPVQPLMHPLWHKPECWSHRSLVLTQWHLCSHRFPNRGGFSSHIPEMFSVNSKHEHIQ